MRPDRGTGRQVFIMKIGQIFALAILSVAFGDAAVAQSFESEKIKRPELKTGKLIEAQKKASATPASSLAQEP